MMEKRDGFTLIEIIIVLVIIAFIASISFSSLFLVIENVKAKAVLKNSAEALYHQIVNARYYSVENETSVFVEFSDSETHSSTSSNFDDLIYQYVLPKEISLSVIDDIVNVSTENYETVYFMGILLKKSSEAYEIVQNATVTLNYNKGNSNLSKQLTIVKGLIRVIE